MKIEIETVQGSKLTFEKVLSDHLRVELSEGIEIISGNCSPIIVESDSNNIVVIGFEITDNSNATNLKLELSPSELVKLKDFVQK